MHNGNEPLLKAFFRNKWIRAILVANIIAVAVVVFLTVRQSAKTSTIDFNIVPINSTISVNGDTHYSNGQYSIEPGNYEIVISREGLESKSLSINIEPKHFVSVVTFLSDADKNFDYYKLKENYESYQQLKTIASADSNKTTDGDTSAQEFITKFERILSIKEKLPIKAFLYKDPNLGTSSAGFSIKDGFGVGCEKIACLLVSYYGKDYEDEVAKKIKEAGYNPDDYELIYKRYAK